MQKHHKLRLITNTLDHEDIWHLSLISALNMVPRSHGTQCHRHKVTPWTVTELRGRVSKPPETRRICRVASRWLERKRRVRSTFGTCSARQRRRTTAEALVQQELRRNLPARWESPQPYHHLTGSGAAPTKQKEGNWDKWSRKKWQR